MRTDAKFLRPADIGQLVGDASKAAAVLDWKPVVDFGALVRGMVDADLTRLSGAAEPAAAGAFESRP